MVINLAVYLRKPFLIDINIHNMGFKSFIVALSSIILLTHGLKAQPRDTLYKIVGAHTFIVPKHYTATINVVAWGGGGGGGTGTNLNLARGGGGAGGIARGVLISAPAGMYDIVVGGGGTPGEAGGASAFSNLVLAVSGKSTFNSSLGGAGGSIGQEVGNYKYKGGDGGAAACETTSPPCGGGGGGGGGEFDASGTDADEIQAASEVEGGLGGTNLLPGMAGRGGNGGHSGDPGSSGINFGGVIPNSMISFGGGGGGKGSGTTSPSANGSSGGVWIDVVSFLPIKLGGFDVHLKSNAAYLEWNTFTENNFEQFIIERSYDGKVFFEAGRVNGKGSSYKESSYSYTDALIKRGTRIYYRLKELDIDGSYSYSVIKSILTTTANEINIFPTIVTSDLIVSAPGVKDGNKDYQVRIYSADGKLIIEKLLLDMNTPFQLSNLQSGMYILNIKSNNDLKTFRFIKQ
ncbi:MAG: T9SS type A sorting domain-containing protein [Saprospiraceae bacterium]